MAGQCSIYEEITTQLIDQIQRECSLCSIQDKTGGDVSGFVKGLLLGQLSVIIVIAFVLRYMFLEDVHQGKKQLSRLSPAAKSQTNMKRVPSTTAHILDKTFYDILHHPPESTDWLNVLLAQAMSQYRDDAQLNDRLILAIDEVLNGGVRPGFFGPIHVTELSLGDEFPIFSNARIRPSDDIGSMRAEIDFEFSDQMSLGVETQLILNWPRVDFAALPISLLLSVVRFSGTLTIELINPPETSTATTIPLDRYVAISSYSDFTLDFTVRSLLGSRTKLEDVPKLTDLITSKLRNVYMDRLVYPNFVKIKIPNMWEARDRKTREQQQSLDEKIMAGAASGLTASAKERMEEFVEDIKEA
ncbi:ERMES complex subunit mmm1 [Umbelopsis nana]